MPPVLTSRIAARPLLALLLTAATVRAANDVWQPDETLPGFKANQAYDSLAVDNVNLFSGDPSIAIPLKPAYPLGGRVTWQLTAHYSSKFWQMSSENCSLPSGNVEARDLALLSGRPSLGPGWSLELGEIAYDVPTGYYRYDSPDGGRHQFRLRSVTDPSGSSATEWMTEDASDLRMVDCSASEGVLCREIHFPDGTRQRFARAFPGNPLPASQRLYRDFYFRFATGPSLLDDERPRLGLSGLYDEYGKRVLAVDPGGGAFPAAVVLRPDEPTLRSEVRFTWSTFPVTGQLGRVDWPVLERISFPTAASSRLLVTFEREARVFPRPGRSCSLAPDVAVPFVTSIRQVAEDAPGEVLAEHSFAYKTGGPEELEGVLETLTLPTRARVEYGYGATSETFECTIAGGAAPAPDQIAIWDDDDPEEIRRFQSYSDRSASVVERRVYQPRASGGDVLLSATRFLRYNAYCRIRNGPGLPNTIVPHRQVIRTDHDGEPATTLPATKEEYLYTIENMTPPGLEVRRRLYRRDWDAAAGTWRFSDSPARVTVNCWEGTDPQGARKTSCGTMQVTGNTYDFQADVRRRKTVTWYGDLPRATDGSYSVTGSDCAQAGTPCLQTESDGYSDTTRRASRELVSVNGSFPVRAGWLGRTTNTTWTRQNVTDPWMFDRVSERTVSDSWTSTCPQAPCHVPAWPPSPSSYTVRQGWDATRPAFLRWVERSDPAQGRLLRSYEPDADGNPERETLAGDGPGIDGTRTYVLRRGFSGGLLTSVRFDGVEWDRYRVDRDPETGAILTSDDPNGLRTSYLYDALGRLIRTTPPAGATPTRLCYRPSSAAGPYVLLKRNPETTDATACSLAEAGATGVLEAYLYDGIGRLRREIRRVPSPDGIPDLAARETRWDAAGRTVWTSEWSSCPASSDIGACFDAPLAAAGTTFSNFDERGRARSLLRPDGTAVTYVYDDDGALGSDFHEDVSEQVSLPGVAPQEWARRRSRKDPFGTLIGAHAPGKNRHGHLAFYEADVLGNVAWVRDHGLSVSQQASLTGAATDPVQLRRFDHDALGLLRREVHPEKSVETVYRLYDPLGNVVEKLEREGPSGPIRATHRFEYDGAGRLVRSTADGQPLVENAYDVPSVDGLNAGRSRGQLVRRTGYNPGAIPAGTVVDHFLYDEAGGRLSERRTTVSATGHVFRQQTTYNSLGLPQTVRRTRPDGSSEVATTTYLAGRPYSLRAGASQWIVKQARYSPFGALQQVTLGNDVVLSIPPDRLGRPSVIEARKAGGLVWTSGAYAYDGNGDIRAIGADTFRYDDGFRLAGSTQGTKGDGFEYDAFGNVARHTRDGLVTDFAPDAATNRLTDTLGTGQLAYDVFGNLIRFPSARATRSSERLSFDLAGRQTRYRDSAIDERYLYDGAGERVARLSAGGGTLQSAIGTDLPPATLSRPYRTGLDVSGGTPPYRWSVTAGSLPPGIVLDTDEGALAGTPVAVGRFSFTLGVRDGAGTFLTRPVSLQVGKSFFYPLTPCRLLDTRDPASEGALIGGTSRLVTPSGRCGIPAEAEALVANVTATVASARTQVTLFPEGPPLPAVLPATVHAAPGLTRAGAAIVPVGTSARFRILTNLPRGGSVHVIVDVAGYFGPSSGASSSATSSATGWSLTFRDGENRLAFELFRDAGGTIRTRDFYHFGPYQVASSSALPGETGYRFYVSDHLGTPRVVTSAAGTVLATYAYRPFGEEITAPLSGPHFCAMEKDASSGNHYDHARYFRSVRARFLSPDVLSGTPEDPASWNRYTYARNNPLKYVDPDGKDAVAVAYVGYRVATPLGPLPLGHSGVSIVRGDGGTKYYEFGRYRPGGQVRYKGPFPNLTMGKNGVPTRDSLKAYMAVLSTEAGQGMPVNAAYFVNDKPAEMTKFAEERRQDSSKQGAYSLTDNNCATFTEDVLDAGGERLDASVVNSPGNVMQELQDRADFSMYFDPRENELTVTCKEGQACPQ